MKIDRLDWIVYRALEDGFNNIFKALRDLLRVDLSIIR